MKSLLGFFVTLALSTAAIAEDFKAPVLSGPVVDEVGLIAPAARAQLEAELTSLYDSGHAQVVVLVTCSLQDLDIADYGIRLAEAWKVGFNGGADKKATNRDRGAILIIAPNERKMRIEVGYGLEGEIPDVVASRILEEVIKPRFRTNQFSDGIVEGAAVLIKLANGDGSQAFPPRQRSRRGGSGNPNLIFFLVICALLSRIPFFLGIPAGGVVGYLLGTALFSSALLGAGAGAIVSGIAYLLGRGTANHGRSGFGSGGGFGGFGGGGFGGGGGGFSGGGGSFGGGGSSSSW